MLGSLRVLESGDLSPGKDDFDRKRRRLPYQMKRFDIEISFSAKVPIRSLVSALRGYENEKSQEAVRVLDIILRQHAAKRRVKNCFHLWHNLHLLMLEIDVWL